MWEFDWLLELTVINAQSRSWSLRAARVGWKVSVRIFCQEFLESFVSKTSRNYLSKTSPNCKKILRGHINKRWQCSSCARNTSSDASTCNYISCRVLCKMSVRGWDTKRVPFCVDHFGVFDRAPSGEKRRWRRNRIKMSSATQEQICQRWSPFCLQTLQSVIILSLSRSKKVVCRNAMSCEHVVSILVSGQWTDQKPLNDCRRMVGAYLPTSPEREEVLQWSPLAWSDTISTTTISN